MVLIVVAIKVAQHLLWGAVKIKKYTTANDEAFERIDIGIYTFEPSPSSIT